MKGIRVWGEKFFLNFSPVFYNALVSFFLLEHVDTCPLKYMNILVFTDLFGSIKKFMWGKNTFVFRI